MSHLMLHAAAVTVLGLALAACTPEPPPTDEPPEPQASAARHTELRDAIQAPIDRAKAVEATVSEAAEQQEAAIDAAAQ